MGHTVALLLCWLAERLHWLTDWLVGAGWIGCVCSDSRKTIKRASLPCCSLPSEEEGVPRLQNLHETLAVPRHCQQNKGAPRKKKYIKKPNNNASALLCAFLHYFFLRGTPLFCWHSRGTASLLCKFCKHGTPSTPEYSSCSHEHVIRCACRRRQGAGTARSRPESETLSRTARE